MKKGLILTVIALAIALIASISQNRRDARKLSIAAANLKAYNEELSSSKEKNIAYQLTVDQLKYSKDSVMQKLNDTRKELKIKDKNLKSMNYVTSVFTRTDTIVMKDTIFKEPSFAIDTLIGDEWYNVQVGLRYPSTVSVRPDFKSEKHVIVSSRKETVNPPKKFFLLRWFQKKHYVLNIDVVEKNPYVQDENSKYVEIIR